MKKIAVFFELPEATAYPLSDPYYLQAYIELTQAVTENGGDFYIVRGQDTYQGQGRFSQSWQFEGQELREKGPVTIEVVYDKGEFVSDGQVKVLNCEEINAICTDKWLMYEKFGQFCPATFKVTTLEEYHQALEKVTTDLAVVKPFDGQEGKGVYIEPKADLKAKFTEITHPHVVQEFLDTSAGIPGFYDGTHDLRVALIDGEPFYVYYRTPPAGSLLANVALGGKMVLIDPKKLPSEIMDIVRVIDAEFAECGHRFYGIDFGWTPTGPKIIEMNSRVGLLANSYDPIYVKLKQKLAEIFMEM